LQKRSARDTYRFCLHILYTQTTWSSSRRNKKQGKLSLFFSPKVSLARLTQGAPVAPHVLGSTPRGSEFLRIQRRLCASSGSRRSSISRIAGSCLPPRGRVARVCSTVEEYKNFL
jgi:hypothetical protein